MTNVNCQHCGTTPGWENHLFPLLCALVDKKRIGGRFLILGSASIDLLLFDKKIDR